MILELLKIWGVFFLFTLVFSLILCFSGNRLFEFHKKDKNKAVIPFYNLMILLEIVKLKRIYIVLLILPVVNIFVIMFILYRLSIMHQLQFYYSIGLILLPIVFLPILNYKMIEIKTLNYERDKNDINLMTDDELSNIETNPGNTIDNIFKAEIKQIEKPPTFKANSVKYKQMMFDEDQMDVLKRLEPVKINNINNNDNVKKEDDSIEIVEL